MTKFQLFIYLLAMLIFWYLPGSIRQEGYSSTFFSNSPLKTMFVINQISFQIPIEDMLIDEFLDRSIGFVPPDIIRDGLPPFATKRDDWRGAPREHEGYDIYADKVNVVAAAAGLVTKVNVTERAGLYVKLQHRPDLSTVYVHLRSARVKKNQIVKPGEIIGRIEGPAGNAISPQLHFEIQIDNQSVDPLPLIQEWYRDDQRIMSKISYYQKLLVENIKERDKQVAKILNSR